MAHEKLVKEGEEAIKKGVRPAEVQDYFLKKGMDSKEAKEEITKLQASRIVQEAKKAQAAKKSAHSGSNSGNKSSTEQKSSFGFWLVILLLIAVIVYFFYADYLSIGMFKDWNFNLK